MEASNLVKEYLRDTDQIKVKDNYHMQMWIERKFNVKMNRPFYIYRGSGGGNEAKLMWSIWNPWGNDQKPCYFYTDMLSVERKLEENNHISLQRWINQNKGSING